MVLVKLGMASRMQIPRPAIAKSALAQRQTRLSIVAGAYFTTLTTPVGLGLRVAQSLSAQLPITGE
jgi:hypothetical protein